MALEVAIYRFSPFSRSGFTFDYKFSFLSLVVGVLWFGVPPCRRCGLSWSVCTHYWGLGVFWFVSWVVVVAVGCAGYGLVCAHCWWCSDLCHGWWSWPCWV
uniref:Transmembrane protein n=1 Tax=Fagus sylvatica TaxID=28930 RepID=A0A2N9HA74_FAGSY